MSGIFSKLYNFFFNADEILHSSRFPWIDYAKGLTIVLVVYHHAFLTLVHAGVKVDAWMINANLSVYSFRMPMFFMLSGLFINRSLQKRGARKYIEVRARILLYPYLLWAALQVTSKLFFSQYMYIPWSFNDYWVILYQPNATGQFWYLITLFNSAVLFTLFSAKLRLSSYQQFFVGIVLYLLSPFLSFNSMIQDTTRFYVYLTFGSLISEFILNKRNFAVFSSGKLFLPLSILMVASQYYLFRHQYLYKLEINFDTKSVNLSSLMVHFWGMLKFSAIVMVGCAFVLNVCCLLQRFGRVTFIRVLGYHSLYIYILHVLIVVGCRIFFVNIIHYTDSYILLPLQILVGMIGSVTIYNMFRHIYLNFLFEYDPASFKLFLKKLNIFPKLQNA